MEWVKLLHVDILSYSAPSRRPEYWVLMESRVPLGPVLERENCCILVLMNRLNKTESAVFLLCRFSLFLKDPFFQFI